MKKLLNENGDKTTKLMIDNCSNVTHLITHKNYIIPIVPEPIPIYKKYQYLYSFLDVWTIRVGMKVNGSDLNIVIMEKLLKDHLQNVVKK